MTKYFCDKCGREIENTAYTISFSLKPLKYDIYQGVFAVANSDADALLFKLQL